MCSPFYVRFTLRLLLDPFFFWRPWNAVFVKVSTFFHSTYPYHVRAPFTRIADEVTFIPCHNPFLTQHSLVN
jgi:hypothetical protein